MTGAPIPFLLRQSLSRGALTTADAAALTRLGILTLADVALLDGTELDGPDLDGIDAGRLGRALRQAAEAIDPPSITLGRAWDVLDRLLPSLQIAVPGLDGVTPSGDVRRFESEVSGLVLVGRAPDPRAALDAIAALPAVESVLHRGETRAILAVERTEIDIHVTAPRDYGRVLFRTTGTPQHVQAVLARRAVGDPTDEEGLYAAAGLPFIAPELRQTGGEIEAAVTGALARDLVTRDAIRGDLHMHSTYSDGRDSLEDMVDACVRLGYEYIAITDHSESAAASRTLTRASLLQQRDEVARLRDRHPSLAILHGVEVDILADGRLDFPDGLLETLDIVLASLHDSAGHDGAALTRRCLAAIRHPLVNVVTHPANRLVGKREGYPLDFDAVYAAAAETGTALEIDGAPSHLDLDGSHARAAVQRGATVVIDSDCHRAQALDRQMRFGVGTARRGWVERQHVLNARPVEAVRAFVAAKRTGRPRE